MTRRAGRHRVLLTRGAEHDLESLFDHVAAQDGTGAAHRLVDQITQVIESLAQFPDRGAHPPELLGLGIREFRQTGFKPYRVIYRVQNDQVVIHLIIDGRRDLQSLLARRLLGA
ncbi:MAG: type II toxin-antitoxin system RelE/ParE family toxin [Betaproteobacteria bacterium]|nr:type II toxin-antitoxin system RelE/ParE family toxin [Betaproteobacteria bacterium]